MALVANYEALTLANHDFSFSLYQELAKTNSGNLFYSPFSIHLIMFMASVGAASTTFDEIIKTIHLNKTTHSLAAYKDLLDELTKENDHLKLAVGMFIDTKFNIEESFVNNAKQFLKSSAEKVNFETQPEEQRNYINNWVLDKTNKKISNLFPKGSITQGTALVLANAVHFKSGWLHKFKETHDETFYLTPSKEITVKMMHLIKDLQYYHDSDLKFAALELPYEHHAFKMIILLPDEKDGLKNLENNFSKIKLHEISNKMSKYNVTVKLPSFKLEQSFELENTLQNLGCQTMFTRNANFTNISKANNLYVSKVVHKAFVDVNELGTEAAAASGLVFTLLSLPLPKPKVQFTADHPFFFAITSYDHVLFSGRVLKLPESITQKKKTIKKL